LLAPGKRKGRLKGQKVETSKPQILEGIVTVDPKGTHVVGSWNLGEILQEQAEFENRDSQSPKGKIDLVHWFGGPHVSWSLRLMIASGGRK
jgi:hypothetical protein